MLNKTFARHFTDTKTIGKEITRNYFEFTKSKGFLKMHHSAYGAGYQSTKYNSYYQYNGRFGTGIVEVSNTSRSKQLVLLTYYIF
jgi:hypothetical protein